MKLFEHQKLGIEFLKKTNKAILADEMGLGKTRQAIIAAKESGNGGVLIICPASLKINWEREIRMVYPEEKIHIISSTDGQIIFDTEERWQIMNYDILEKKLEYITNLINCGWDTLILDEAHYIKGKSIRAACIVGGSAKKKEKGDQVRIRHEGIAGKMKKVYALTGTPLLNRPIEMFNLLRAIGHELGNVRGAFAKRYCGAYLKTIIRRFGSPIIYVDETGATNLDELRIRLQGYMLRRKKKDVLDLPDKIVSIMECEMSPYWEKTYETAWENYLEFLEKNPLLGKNIDNVKMARHLVELTKLKQVCSQSKTDIIVSDIKNAVEQEEKVVVFSQYTETIKNISEKLTGIKIRNVTLTGADDMQERQKAVDDFQEDPEVKVFIANIKAGGVGINLTKASIVIFADMDWSPEIHRQAEDRAHRIGQEGTVNVYYYICTETIEEDIVEILNSKKNVMDKILEGKAVGKSETMQEAFLKLMAKKQKK